MTQQPLADKLRPTSLADFLGQDELVGENGVIRKLLATGNLPSMIFWGPPATGKTSLAKIIAKSSEADFLSISAVMEGKEQFKKAIAQAKINAQHGQKTILFVDEIHRWNKAQQDALLPYVEDGTIVLIGATTENPSFQVVSALLSRLRVFVFHPHSVEDILDKLKQGLSVLRKDRASEDVQIGDEDSQALEYLAQMSNGDIRFALNTLQIAFDISEDHINAQSIAQATQTFLRHDKDGEEHYNLISAVHKSLRSSNPSAAVYWVVRMLSAGDDPLYVARRLIRFASEDIGNANPNALLLANQVFDSCHKIGMPECEVILVQLAEYLAKSPKNNSAYVAMNQAKADVKKYGNLPVPLHFRNAPTKLMGELGYGEGYEYDHDLDNKKSSQECFPNELKGRDYFKG